VAAQTSVSEVKVIVAAGMVYTPGVVAVLTTGTGTTNSVEVETAAAAEVEEVEAKGVVGAGW
jgi:hypothetical protein